MAEVPKVVSPSLATIEPGDQTKVGPLLVGEDIAAGDACYIKTADGKVYRSNGSAVAPASEVDGYAPTAAKAAQRAPVSLYHDVNFSYGAGLSPGTYLYLSGTVPGGLADAAAAGQAKPIARVIEANKIRVLRTY